MQSTRPYVLSIAGFDPSGGAGVLADCKTFEQHGVYGFGVCSALTVQNDNEFISLQWLSAEQVLEQLQPLTKKFLITACKIGIIRSLESLGVIIRFLKQHNPSMHIVWDTVLKASAGYAFHNGSSFAELEEILSMATCITPNYDELTYLQTVGNRPLVTGDRAAFCAVLLKGGHRPDAPGTDTLFEQSGHTVIPAGVGKVYPKHGSGCVLSAAITARLAQGYMLPISCGMAKRYIESFLNSNETLLGYHQVC